MVDQEDELIHAAASENDLPPIWNANYFGISLEYFWLWKLMIEDCWTQIMDHMTQ